MIVVEIGFLWLGALILGVASMGLVMSWAYDTRRLTPAPIYEELDDGAILGGEGA